MWFKLGIKQTKFHQYHLTESKIFIKVVFNFSNNFILY